MDETNTLPEHTHIISELHPQTDGVGEYVATLNDPDSTQIPVPASAAVGDIVRFVNSGIDIYTAKEFFNLNPTTTICK